MIVVSLGLRMKNFWTSIFGFGISTASTSRSSATVSGFYLFCENNEKLMSELALDIAYGEVTSFFRSFADVNTGSELLSSIR